jgi:hypothetical protein
VVKENSPFLGLASATVLDLVRLRGLGAYPPLPTRRFVTVNLKIACTHATTYYTRTRLHSSLTASLATTLVPLAQHILAYSAEDSATNVTFALDIRTQNHDVWENLPLRKTHPWKSKHKTQIVAPRKPIKKQSGRHTATSHLGKFQGKRISRKHKRRHRKTQTHLSAPNTQHAGPAASPPLWKQAVARGRQRRPSISPVKLQSGRHRSERW